MSLFVVDAFVVVVFFSESRNFLRVSFYSRLICYCVVAISTADLKQMSMLTLYASFKFFHTVVAVVVYKCP